MFKIVLVPIDGSEGSIRAVDHCIEVAKCMAVDKIVLVHVSAIPDRLQSISGKLGSMFFKMKDELAEYGEEKLAEAKERIEKHNLNVNLETRLLFGDEAYNIIEEANKQKCDLIVIGSRGLSGIQSKLMGSVSNYVVQHAKCTVHVVKKKKD